MQPRVYEPWCWLSLWHQSVWHPSNWRVKRTKCLWSCQCLLLSARWLRQWAEWARVSSEMGGVRIKILMRIKNQWLQGEIHWNRLQNSRSQSMRLHRSVSWSEKTKFTRSEAEVNHKSIQRSEASTPVVQFRLHRRAGARVSYQKSTTWLKAPPQRVSYVTSILCDFLTVSESNLETVLSLKFVKASLVI